MESIHDAKKRIAARRKEEPIVTESIPEGQQLLSMKVAEDEITGEFDYALRYERLREMARLESTAPTKTLEPFMPRPVTRVLGMRKAGLLKYIGYALWMQGHVNRSPNAEYCKLGEYYRDGYLAFAMSQETMAKEFDCHKNTIGNVWRLFKKHEIIKKIGYELPSPDAKEESRIPVFALGECGRSDDGYLFEIWYIDVVAGSYRDPAEIERFRKLFPHADAIRSSTTNDERSATNDEHKNLCT